MLVRPTGGRLGLDTTDVAATTGLEAALHGWAGAPTPSPEHAPMG
ncbi:hypothetical protein O1M63_10895 [Streptomyces mirabilis]|nr:hypothetical protein [Streptomyces mirabilis]